MRVTVTTNPPPMQCTTFLHFSKSLEIGRQSLVLVLLAGTLSQFRIQEKVIIWFTLLVPLLGKV